MSSLANKNGNVAENESNPGSLIISQKLKRLA
jgi:hypothetical protein